jgi:NAD(P)-dependent dehydrogenase (short-subunit alcohol dehydrogenase family)
MKQDHKSMPQLENKVAVITGGNSGIGFATAKRFAAEGAKVIITGRRKEAVDEAVAGMGENVSGIVADASVLSDTDRMIEQIRRDHGKIDVLFVNAGVAPILPFDQTDEATFDQVFGINVKGLYFTVQKALPLLNSGASVILNASVVSKMGFPGGSAYAASKAAVRSIGQTVAAELASKGIRVNLLSPGPVETPIYGKTGLPKEAVDEMGAAFAARIPLGRFGTADEMANVAVFLASDESSYITGSDIQADGGMTQAFV